MPKSAVLLTVLALLLSGVPGLIPTSETGKAWAQDDDDDDGGGDDDDGGRSFSRDRSDDDRAAPRPRATQRVIRRAAPAVPRRAPPPPAPPPPAFAPAEIVALSLTEADLAALVAQGFAVIEEATVPGIATVPRRLSVPAALTLAQARDAVRALPSGQDTDFNHYYRSEQGFSSDCRGADCPARLMIGWPLRPERDATCGSGISIGMVDTGINAAHETFRGARLELRRFGPEAREASAALHGTAVAALLVGEPETRSPGLVPGARLVAVDAFHRARGDERADVFTLVKALGFLAGEGVSVLNLSLAGPDNAVLARTVEILVRERDIVVVSAVGNDGPRAEPAYPAAYEPVIAVTAVDRTGTVYRRAIRGPHVDLAAPGVNVWTAASVSGARWKTGTSFAVPFVTAAAAMLRESRPELDAAGVVSALRAGAADLGEPGPDPVFGAGLLSIAGLCPPVPAQGGN